MGARDLVECLCLQLAHIGEDGTAAETIIRFHMDKLQTHHYKELAAELKLDIEDLQAEIEIIRHLDPRPGRKYGIERSNYVVPDVYVATLKIVRWRSSRLLIRRKAARSLLRTYSFASDGASPSAPRETMRR